MSSRRQSQAAASPNPPEDPKEETVFMIRVAPVRWNWLSSSISSQRRECFCCSTASHTLHFLVLAKDSNSSKNNISQITTSSGQCRYQQLKAVVMILQRLSFVSLPLSLNMTRGESEDRISQNRILHCSHRHLYLKVSMRVGYICL